MALGPKEAMRRGLIEEPSAISAGHTVNLDWFIRLQLMRIDGKFLDDDLVRCAETCPQIFLEEFHQGTAINAFSSVQITSRKDGNVDGRECRLFCEHVGLEQWWLRVPNVRVKPAPTA